MKFRNMFLKYHTPAGVDGADAGGAGAGSNESKTETKAADSSADNKPSEKEAELLKEVMKKKTKIETLSSELEKYKGVDLERYSALIANEADAKSKAEKAEKERLKSEGKFEELLSLKEQEHTSILEQVRTQLAQEMSQQKETAQSLLAEKAQLQSQIEELTVGSAFAGSGFIKDKLVSAFTPNRTRKLYGDYFDFNDGKVVGYNKPRGAEGRAPLVNKEGHSLTFDAALAKLIEGDSDADAMLRSDAKVGAGSNSSGLKSKHKVTVGSGISRISYSLSKSEK